MRILCVGAAHWDLIARADRPLAPGADVPGRIERRPGGVALNVARALAGGGLAVGLRARVGSDAAGEALADAIRKLGIDTGPMLGSPEATDCYLAIEEPDGEIFAAVADCSGLEASGTALAGPVPPDWDRVVVDGNLPPAALEAFAASGAGERLAVAGASPAKAQRLLPLARAGACLYLNRLEAEALCGRRLGGSREAALALRALGAGAAIVTDGAAEAASSIGGSLSALTPETAATRSLTGAGDRFLAAHLAARLSGAAPEAALAAALQAASRHITEVP